VAYTLSDTVGYPNLVAVCATQLNRHSSSVRFSSVALYTHAFKSCATDIGVTKVNVNDILRFLHEPEPNSWSEALYSLGIGSWLAWANGTHRHVTHTKRINCPISEKTETDIFILAVWNFSSRWCYVLLLMFIFFTATARDFRIPSADRRET